MTTIVSISALGASLVIAIVIIAFAASANAAGTNATRVATSAKKSSQVGREYYDSIPTGGKELEEFMAIGGSFIMLAVNSTHLYREIKKVYDCHRLCIECFKGLNYTWRQRLLRYAPFAILVVLSSFSIIGVLR